jgi:hypothetical protein
MAGSDAVSVGDPGVQNFFAQFFSQIPIYMGSPGIRIEIYRREVQML